MANWREMIADEMKAHGETFDDAEQMCAATNSYRPEDQIPYTNNSWLDIEFDDGYGGTEGAFFTIWTKNRVYFPGSYDGAEFVASVSRNPNGQPTEHVGGG